MFPRSSHAHICISDTYTCHSVFSIFQKIWEKISPCQLEVHLPNCFTSEIAETPSRAKSIPVSSLLRENSCDALSWIYRLELICTYEGVLHFQFTFYNRLNVCQMGNFIFYGALFSHRQTIQIYFIAFKLLGVSRATGEQQSLPWYPAKASWQRGQATFPRLQTAMQQGRPNLSSVYSLLVLLLLCGLPLKIC